MVWFNISHNSQIYASFKFLNFFYLLIAEGIFIFNTLSKKTQKNYLKKREHIKNVESDFLAWKCRQLNPSVLLTEQKGPTYRCIFL